MKPNNRIFQKYYIFPLMIFTVAFLLIAAVLGVYGYLLLAVDKLYAVGLFSAAAVCVLVFGFLFYYFKKHVKGSCLKLQQASERIEKLFTEDEIASMKTIAGEDPFEYMALCLDYSTDTAESEKREEYRFKALENALYSSNDILWIKKPNSELFDILVPPYWTETYPESSLPTPLNLYDYIHPEFADAFQKALEKMSLYPQHSVTLRLRFLVSQNRWVLCVFKGRSLKTPSGEVVLSGFLSDIDQKVQLEESVKQSQAMYRFALQAVADIIYEADIEENRFICTNTQQWYSLFNIDIRSKGFNEIRKQYWELIHPDYIESYLDRFYNYDHMLLLPNKSVSYEYRVKNKNEEYIWVNHMVTVVSSADGKALKIIGQISDINEKKHRELKVIYQSNHDGLTGAFLRGAIIKEFNKLLKEKRQNFGMMVIDIDNFKHINDRYGHIVGDYALQHLVNILWASQKMECSVGRLGGDEFVVLMKDIKDYALVDQMSDYIINAIKEPARLDNAWVNLTVSIGIAFFGQHGTTYEDLFYAADIALYEAKRRGKNQYVIYQETLPRSCPFPKQPDQ